MALTDDIRRATTTADTVRMLREDLRHTVKPGDPERESAIAAALDDLAEAMAPLRAAIGRMIWGDAEAERLEKPLRAASRALQYERKQLKKMRRS